MSEGVVFQVPALVMSKEKFAEWVGVSVRQVVGMMERGELPCVQSKPNSPRLVNCIAYQKQLIDAAKDQF